MSTIQSKLPQQQLRPVYHLAEPDEWAAASQNDTYVPSGYAEEGFIHLSERDQVAVNSARFFPGRDDLVLLTIDERLLTSELKREHSDPEAPPKGPLFPHLYGPLNMHAVIATRVYSSGQQP
jgi:uncharacterized protein (DUF952 family)